MESCGLKCLKWLMFVFNLLFFICGCILLGLGIWVVVDGASFVDLFATSDGTSSVFFNAAYIFIAVGCALIVISFFGFCGALKESKCMLGTFFAVVLIIFIIEIVGAILAFVYYPQVADAIVESMSRYEPGDNNNTYTAAWDAFQRVIPCCGFNASTNWIQYGPYPISSGVTTEVLPPSCCLRNDEETSAGLAACQQRGIEVHPDGCETQLSSYYWVIGGVGIAILVVELLAMIFACCLFRAAGKDDNYA